MIPVERSNPTLAACPRTPVHVSYIMSSGRSRDSWNSMPFLTMMLRIADNRTRLGIAQYQSVFLSLSLFFASASSRLVNITVDDTLGDPTTGSLPEYLPDYAGWSINSSYEYCQESSCYIDPSILDLSQIHNKTWHSSMPIDTLATITVRFNGSAVYIFNILPNTIPSTDTGANISFSIDGENVSRFIRSPDPGTNILYNQLVYHNTTLDDGPHILIMTPDNSSLIMFDYFIYTAQDNDTTPVNSSSTTQQPSSTSLPTIPLSTNNPGNPLPSSSNHTTRPVEDVVGAVLGSIALLGVLVAAFILCRRCQRRRSPMQIFPPNSPDCENNYERYGEYNACEDRRADGASCGPMFSLTPAIISPLSFLNGISTHNEPRPDSALHTSLQATVGASPEPSTVDQSSNHFAELTLRLETLQHARPVLPSQAPSESRLSRSEVSSEGGTEAAIRDLEAEISQLRAVLAAINARFIDGPDSDELLPAYAE